MLTDYFKMAISDVSTDSTLKMAAPGEDTSSPVVVTMDKMDKAGEIAKLGSERLDYQVNSSPSRKSKKKATPKPAIERSVDSLRQAIQ